MSLWSILLTLVAGANARAAGSVTAIGNPAN